MFCTIIQVISVNSGCLRNWE